MKSSTSKPGLRQQSTKVNCPFPQCGRQFHLNSLSNHIKTKHGSDQRKEITLSRHLNGVCVDQTNGIYLIRQQMRGTDHPIHCQFKISHPPSIVCSVENCCKLSATASRSGKCNFLCDHLKSSQFLSSQHRPLSSQLNEESLSYVTDTLKWLKPERKVECLEWKQQSSLLDVPLVVQLPALTDSARFLHISVFANVKTDHYWSFCNRVVVTFHKEDSSFHCKCCCSRHSCTHKSIVKWALSQ